MRAPPWDTTPTRAQPRAAASAATFSSPRDTRSVTCWALSPTGMLAKSGCSPMPIHA